MTSPVQSLPGSPASLFAERSTKAPAHLGVCGLAMVAILSSSPISPAAETLYWDSEGFFETEFVYYDDPLNWWVFNNGFIPTWGTPIITDRVIFGWLEAPTVVDFAANGVAGEVIFSDPTFSDTLIEIYLNGWSWTIASELAVGTFDGSGDVEIIDGFVDADRVWIGEEDFGSLLLDDAILTASGAFSAVGDFDGVGDLVLVGSSRFETLGAADLVVGYDGGDGLVSLEDPDSSLEVADLYLGHGLETNGVMINGTGSLSVDGGIVDADSVTVALETGDEGTVELLGFDSWLLAGFVTVGERGDGLLTMDFGALLEAEELSFGFDFGSVGNGTISGVDTDVILASQDPDFSSILEVGGSGIGTLVLSDDAFLSTDRIFIGAAEDGLGTMVVQAATLETGDVFSSIGEAGGDGLLTLSDGGIWDNGFGATTVGAEGGEGSVVLDHADSAFISDGILQLGWNSDDVTESFGSMVVNAGSATIFNEVYVGDSPNTLGDLVVTGAASNFDATEPVFIGYSGDGLLELNNGAGMGTPEFYIGVNSGSIGEADIAGAGTVLDVSNSDPDVSSVLDLAWRGDALMLIRDGALVFADRVFAGQDENVEGRITLDGGMLLTGDAFSVIGETGGFGVVTLGAQGAWTNGAGELVFGEDGGTGRMEVDGAGAAFDTNSNVWLGANTDNATASRGEWAITNGSAEINGFLAIAGSEGTFGELTVSGANATLDVKGVDFPDTGTLVGWGGRGSMDVLAGGRVRVDSFLTVGALGGAEGDVVISGSGSRLDIMGDFSGALRVGEAGKGALRVSNGGILTSQNMEVGFGATSDGRGVVSGSGARIELIDSLAVGGSNAAAGGTGVLEIRNNGVVDAGGAATFWQNSSLTLDGGTLIADGGMIGAGALVSGTGTIQGNVISSATTYRPGLSVGQLSIQGSWTLSGSDTVEMDLGGAAPSQNDRFAVNGGIQLNQATLTLTLLPSFENSSIPVGTEITLISKSGSSPIQGRFSNVAEGDVITLGGHFFLASYVGGTGNDFTLTVIDEPTAAYAAWSGGAEFNADANGDGVANGLAWVLGASDPSANAIGLLPTFDHSSDPDFFIFTYRRNADAHADATTTIEAEYSSNLTDWTEAVVGQDVMISVDPNAAGAGIDLVEVKIRRTLAVGGRLFARLRVEHDGP